MIGRSVTAVWARAEGIGIKSNRDGPGGNWTDEELGKTIRWYRDHEGIPLELDKLAADLGRHKANVSRKARALGLTNRQRNKVERGADGLRPCDVRRKPKYETAEERGRATSERVKKLIAEHGHPRGMLGKHHTDEVKKAQAERNRQMIANRTPEERERIRQKTTETNLMRYGVANPIAFLAPETVYSRSKSGYIDDIPGIFFRSMWECNYARYLDWLKGQGEIADWSYEPDAFVFHGVVRAPVTYTPDFKVTETDGSVVYHEVKGWMDGKSSSKLKRMAKFYPDVKIVVIDEAAYRSIAGWHALVPFWGEPPREGTEEERAERKKQAQQRFRQRKREAVAK